LLVVSVLWILPVADVQAQEKPDGFLFRAPAGQVSIRGGFDRAMAGSDLFTFVINELTLSDREYRRSDFSSLTFATDFDYALMPRLGVQFGVGVSRSTIPSQFKNFVDNSRREIEQTTSYTRVPLTGSVKAYLANPGRSVGHFAWIPTRYAPYAGGGAGAMYYKFEQVGDVIDFETFRVFPDRFVSEGWAPMALAFVGTDISLSPRFAVTAEGRYQWARSHLSPDFRRFDPIDLSGFSLTAGVSIRY
jgi:hypothetical protein